MKRLFAILAVLLLGLAAVPAAHAVIVGGPPLNLDLPLITGTPQVASTLTCSDGNWAGADTFTRRWLRDGTAIDGATGAQYVPQAADVGHALVCEVTATSGFGSTPASSAPTALVTDAPPSLPPPPAGPPGPGPPTGPGSTPPPAGDLSALPSAPACVAIPSVARDRSVRLARGGKVTLVTRQVDDAGSPLKASAKSVGAPAVATVAFTVNGRALDPSRAGAIPVAMLRAGSRPNKLVARVTLRDGRKTTVTQLFVVTRCPLPIVACKRLGGGRSLKCTSRTPLGGRRVTVTVTGPASQRATGAASVKKGRYSVTVRCAGALPAGRYWYRHVVKTGKRGERMFMIRSVSVA